MNPLDEQLDRLFRAARPVRAGGPMTPPFGLETRVLAAWREGERFDLWNPALLRRGLLLASLLMALSLWPALEKMADPGSDSLQLADSTLQLGNSP
jgi:hypothetical protein